MTKKWTLPLAALAFSLTVTPFSTFAADEAPPRRRMRESIPESCRPRRPANVPLRRNGCRVRNGFAARRGWMKSSA